MARAPKSLKGINKQPARKRRNSSVPDLLGRDLQILEGLGLDTLKMQSESYNAKIISEMGMRQLDRLKMIFLRNDWFVKTLSIRMAEGIEKNDLSVFSEVLTHLSVLLNGKSQKEM